MHAAIYRTYAALLEKLDFSGPVLEVGALPSERSLLCLPALRNHERVGLNIDGPHRYDGFEILKGNANAMPFEDNRFGLVLCNAVIEHVPDFWTVVSEIKRVTASGGTVVIGAPGYRQFPGLERWQNFLRRRLPSLAKSPTLNALFTATIVFQVHNEPADYWRFSDQAFRGPIMAGLEDVTVQSVMLPPRLIGVGKKP